MGSFSIWHWLIVLAVILVLFGGGNKISGLMGDFAKGINQRKRRGFGKSSALGLSFRIGLDGFIH